MAAVGILNGVGAAAPRGGETGSVEVPFSTLCVGLLIAAFLAGLAVLCILPPFEGFDETAHWSSLQELADTGTIPRYGVDHISRDIDHYAGPLPYAVPGVEGHKATYQEFRLAPAPLTHPSRYSQGQSLNWEAQHPPLYYGLLAPLYRSVRSWDMPGGFLALRLASWCLAMVGLTLAVEGTRRYATDGARAALFIAAWPFLIPEFLPEMARIGNDSLCLLLSGAGWVALMRLFSPRGGWGSALALGVTLGLGLLTKALFLPILFGTGVLLFARWAVERRSRALRDLAIAAGIAVAIGGWWYADRYLTTGSLSGSDEFIQLQKHGGGLLGNLAARLSIVELLKGCANIVIGFLWGGTWSLAQPHTLLLLGPAALIGWPLVNWLREWREMTWCDGAALVWTAPLAASLVYHVLVLIAFTGSGVGTPGHYLHIVAPALAFAVARGWRWRWTGAALSLWTGLFTLYIWSMELSLFSGCAGKDPIHNHYILSRSCFVDGSTLSILGHPWLAASAAGLSLLLLIGSVVALVRRLPQPQNQDLIAI